MSDREDAAAGRLRGDALVEVVIGTLRDRGEMERIFGRGGPVGLAPERVEALALPGNKPLPPSLRRWLAFDAGALGLVDDPARPAFDPRPLWEHMEEALPGWGSSFESIGAKALPEPCLLFVGSGEARELLYLGQPDEHGELPIFRAGVDDLPLVELVDPGLDVLLARRFGVIDWPGSLFAHAVLGAAMREQALHNFQGYKRCDEVGVETERVEGAPAPPAPGARPQKKKSAKRR